MSRGERAPRPTGPIGPWRLTVVVGVTAAATGRALLDAAGSGTGADLALGRSLALAAVTWLALGGINRVLAQVDHQAVEVPDADDTVRPDAGPAAAAGDVTSLDDAA